MTCSVQSHQKAKVAQKKNVEENCFHGHCFENTQKSISFCWSSQCFQLHISHSQISLVGVCVDFVHWADSFIIDQLISCEKQQTKMCKTTLRTRWTINHQIENATHVIDMTIEEHAAQENHKWIQLSMICIFASNCLKQP